MARNTYPCLVCAEEISPNADPCPHCGEPDAGAKSVNIDTRAIADEQALAIAEKRAETERKLDNWLDLIASSLALPLLFAPLCIWLIPAFWPFWVPALLALFVLSLGFFKALGSASKFVFNLVRRVFGLSKKAAVVLFLIAFVLLSIWANA